MWGGQEGASRARTPQGLSVAPRDGQSSAESPPPPRNLQVRKGRLRKVACTSQGHTACTKRNWGRDTGWFVLLLIRCSFCPGRLSSGTVFPFKRPSFPYSVRIAPALPIFRGCCEA